MAESKELKSLLVKVKEEHEEVGSKLNIQKTKIMASGPITSWQISEENNGNSDRLYFGRLQNHCKCWLQPWNYKRHLFLGRKAMTNLDSTLKSRHITLPTKVHIVKAMVFPVVTYGCEGWTIKKAEHQRIDAFELWCWRRLLRVPGTAKGSNQSILKEISPEYSLEGLMLNLQYFGYLIWGTDLLKRPWSWERLKEREGDDRGWDGCMASPTQWTWVWASSGSWWWTGKPGVLQSMGLQRLSVWTELNMYNWRPGTGRWQDGRCTNMRIWLQRKVWKIMDENFLY